MSKEYATHYGLRHLLPVTALMIVYAYLFGLPDHKNEIDWWIGIGGGASSIIAAFAWPVLVARANRAPLDGVRRLAIKTSIHGLIGCGVALATPFLLPFEGTWVSVSTALLWWGASMACLSMMISPTLILSARYFFPLRATEKLPATNRTNGRPRS